MAQVVFSAFMSSPASADADHSMDDADIASLSSPSSPAFGPAPASASAPSSPREKRSAATPISAELDPRQRYVLHKELQKSIYGKMYMGTDVTTNENVALKVSVRRLLDSHLSLSGVEVLEDPREEAALMEHVKGHRNVVNLVATHEDADLHWMAQEFVSGGDLFDALSRAGQYSPADTRSIFSQILSGLAHLHSRNVAHLDLSLENLLVGSDGTIKICDFGLARKFDRHRKLPNGRNRPGKYGYMAPEVLAGNDFDGVKADVFSAGVVLFSLLTGHPPFEHARMQDRRYRFIAQGQLAEMLRALRLHHLVPSEAAELITGMLHPDPDRRMSLEQVTNHPWMQGDAVVN